MPQVSFGTFSFARLFGFRWEVLMTDEKLS
jgi:hypothetical protein